MRRGSSIATALAVFATLSSAHAAGAIPNCRGPGLTPPVPLTSHVATSEDYPPLSRMLNETGASIIEYHIMPDGLVDSLKLTRSSGSLRLDDAALAFVKRFRFKPALMASVATECTNAIEISWQLQSNDENALNALSAFTGAALYVPRSDFPSGAAERNEEGYAVAVVFVSDHNTIDQIVLVKPTPYADLNAATVALLVKKKVTSPAIGGSPSRSMIAIPVVWSLGKPPSTPLPTHAAPVPEGADKPDDAQAPSPKSPITHGEK